MSNSREHSDAWQYAWKHWGAWFRDNGHTCNVSLKSCMCRMADWLIAQSDYRSLTKNEQRVGARQVRDAVRVVMTDLRMRGRVA